MKNSKKMGTDVIGLSLEEAKKIYGSIRVVKEDGIPKVVTMDLKMTRMNVEVIDGKIVSIVKFG
jgi:hypothetical protein